MRFRLTGVASGLNCTMPNGMVAPGNTLPPLVVPMKGLTSDAGSDEAESAMQDGTAARASSEINGKHVRRKQACMPSRVRHARQEGIGALEAARNSALEYRSYGSTLRWPVVCIGSRFGAERCTSAGRIRHDRKWIREFAAA